MVKSVLILIVISCIVNGCTSSWKPFKSNAKIEIPTGTAENTKLPCKYQFTEMFDDNIAKEERSKDSLFTNICTDDKSDSNRMSLSIIEFDDDGLLREEKQFSRTIQEIRWLSKMQSCKHVASENENQKQAIECSGYLPSEGVFLVLFVHGWKNDASWKSPSLVGFTGLLREMANSHKICNERSSDGKECLSKPHVLGVYVGWRGASVKVGKPKQFNDGVGASWIDTGIEHTFQTFTFWNRKRAARRIAGSTMTGVFVVLLDELDLADQVRRETGLVSKFARSRSLLMGHSLGASVIEHAVSQSFIAQRYAARGTFAKILNERKTLKKFVDKIKDLAEKKPKLEYEKTKAIGEKKALSEKIRYFETEIERHSLNLRSFHESKHRENLENYRDSYYRAFTSPSNVCFEFDEQWENACSLQDVTTQNLRIAAPCLTQQLSCLYETYICSITESRQLAKNVKAKARITSFMDQLLKRHTRPLNCIGGHTPENDSLNFSNLDHWKAFLSDLVVYYNKIPDLSSFQLERHEKHNLSVLRDEYMVDKGRELQTIMEHWDIGPSGVLFDRFAPLIWGTDHTDKCEKQLQKHIDAAMEHIGVVISGSRDYLRSIESSREEARKADSEKTEMLKKIKEKLNKTRERDLVIESFKNIKLQIKAIESETCALEEDKEQGSAKLANELDGFVRYQGDLVLLLNPASSALNARVLEKSMSLVKTGEEQLIENLKILIPNYTKTKDRPWIVSLTSVKDTATKRIFPLATRASRLFSRTRPSGGFDGDTFTTTSGHHELTVDHCVDVLKNPEFCRESADPIVTFTDRDRIEYAMFRNGPDSKNKEPLGSYWVAQAPGKVIENHSDIFNSKVVGFIIEMVDHNRMFSPLCPSYDAQNCKCEGDSRNSMQVNNEFEHECPKDPA